MSEQVDIVERLEVESERLNSSLISQAANEIERLRTKIAEFEVMAEAANKLPITADGVLVIPGPDHVWCAENIERRIEWRHNPRSPNKRKNGWWTRPVGGMCEWSDIPVSECFSEPPKKGSE